MLPDGAVRDVGVDLERLVHDLRHALATVVAATEVLENDMSGSRDARPVSAVRAAAFMAARIVEQFPVDQAAVEPACVAVDVAAQAASVFGVVFAPRVAVRSRLSETGRVAVPRSVLEAAVLNLCVNAGAAMPSGGTMTISCGPCGDLAHAQRCVAVSVSDTGSGMGADQFEAVLAGAARRSRTSGVGLAATASALRAVGADLTASCVPGAGMTVTLHLPEVGASPDLVASPYWLAVNETGSLTLGSTRLGEDTVSSAVRDAAAVWRRTVPQRPVVAVVDDDDVLADYVAVMLRRAGLAVCTYRSLVELAAGTTPLDLVLVDLHLDRSSAGKSNADPVSVPGGVAVAEDARSRHGAEVVFMTGDPALASRTLRDEKVLLKPFSTDALLAVLRDTFERRFAQAC